MASSSASSRSNVVILPTYDLAHTRLLKAIENAASVQFTSTDERGEYFAMAVAEKLAKADVPANAVIVIPEKEPSDNESLDLSFVASSPHIYVTLMGVPQSIMTYGSFTGCSEETDILVESGKTIKFPTPSHFLVAKTVLIEAIARMQQTILLEDALIADKGQKKQCLRQLVVEGEQPEASIDKGMSKYLLDLEGVKLFSRVKCDIPQREKQLFFSFRAMEPERWQYSMGTDLELQAEEYSRMLFEQHQTRADRRERAFSACGILDRVVNLEVAVKITKLEFLLTGSVLVLGTTSTLTLEDFTSGEKILSDCSICPNQNQALVATLRNVQAMLQIVFSASFRDCFKEFIESLEGENRSMELAPSDFLKHAVENTLRQCFRVIRSVKATELAEGVSVRNPSECADFFRRSFAQLEKDMRDDNPLRQIEEAYFRKRSASILSTPAKAAKTPKLKDDIRVVEPLKDDLRPCANDIGSQLKVKNTKGVLYKCEYGKSCRYDHINISRKTAKEIRAIVELLPVRVQNDVKKSAAGKDRQ